MLLKKYSLWERIKRVVKYRLFIPVKRVKLPPVVKARGIAVGVAWAMTPLIGIQMWLVFITWVIFKKLFKFDFSLALGLAFTWITNVITMIPVYYVFYITGQFMRCGVVDSSGYSMLVGVVKENFMGDISFLDKWTLIFKILLKDWGVSMVVGCIPWCIISTIISYKLAMKYEMKRQEKLKMQKI